MNFGAGNSWDTLRVLFEIIALFKQTNKKYLINGNFIIKIEHSRETMIFPVEAASAVGECVGLAVLTDRWPGVAASPPPRARRTAGSRAGVRPGTGSEFILNSLCRAGPGEATVMRVPPSHLGSVWSVTPACPPGGCQWVVLGRNLATVIFLSDLPSEFYFSF